MLWEYQCHGVCVDERLQALRGSPSFEDIVTQLDREMSIVCYHKEPCRARSEYSRAIFCVEVTHELFDVFFNSPTGYRGAYFESPEQGRIANRLLLNTAMPKLVTWEHANCPDKKEPDFVAKSLSEESAKAWLAEEQAFICEQCKGEWHASLQVDCEINNGRWECDTHLHAKWGRQAYQFRKIRFFGAFLNDKGEEYVAGHKKCRAQDIHQWGWS